MKITSNMILFVLFLLIFFLVSCNTISTENDYLFSDVYDIKDFNPHYSKIEDAPGAFFQTKYVWEEPDISDTSALYLVCKKNNWKYVIGYSARDIESFWVKTQIGDLLVVNHTYDTHFSESFVVYPHTDDEGKIEVDVLYSTPRIEVRSEYMEHKYTRIKNISVDGIMEIWMGWDYGPSDDGYEIVTKIPLFYGLHKK